MARVKNYQTTAENVKAIQFVRNAISEIYDFIDNRDCTFNFKNDKFSGIVTDKFGCKLNLNGKDYLVKDNEENLSVWKPEDFNKHFTETSTSV